MEQSVEELKMNVIKVQSATNNVPIKGRIIVPQIRMSKTFETIEIEAGKLVAKELEKLGEVSKLKEIIDRNIFNGRCHYVHGINEAMSKEFAQKVYNKV